MPEYTVYFVQTVSTSVTVEADNKDAAVDLAFDQVPSATNSTNHGVDSSGEWTEVSIELDGAEVWSDYPQDEVNALCLQVAALRKLATDTSDGTVKASDILAALNAGPAFTT